MVNVLTYNALGGIGALSFPALISLSTDNYSGVSSVYFVDTDADATPDTWLNLASSIGDPANQYFTTNADDQIFVRGKESVGGGSYFNAFTKATIRLEGGNDVLGLFGLPNEGVQQKNSVIVSFANSSGYISQSFVDAGAGDDRLVVYMPWASIFVGGTNSTAYTYSPGDSPFLLAKGDSIELQGSRSDWDLEFRDVDGGGVTLNSLRDGLDSIVTSNNNEIRGFERFIFADSVFDLWVYDQLLQSSFYGGQPDYYLFGQEASPTLNSSITDSKIWEAFYFNRTKLAGIVGAPTQRVAIMTGDTADTPYIVQAVRYADLLTAAGGDTVTIEGVLEFASLNTGLDADLVTVGSIASSELIVGDAADINNDTVEVKGSLSRAIIRGGGGTGDVLVLAGDFADGTIVNEAARDEVGELYYQLGDNRFYGFEQIQILNPFTPGTDTPPPPPPPPDGDGNGGGGGGIAADLDLDAFFQSTTDGITAIRELIQARLDEANAFNPFDKPGVISPDPTQFGVQFLVGTVADDVIEGGIGNEIIRSRTGRDLVLGGFGVDRFEFDFRDGLLSGDLILDFDQDKLALTNIPESLTLGKNGKPGKSFAVVKTQRKAEKSKALVVYQVGTGELFFNANRNLLGFGDNGGLIARLEPGLPLTSMEISIETVPDFPGL